jgi:hypothetical protein
MDEAQRGDERDPEAGGDEGVAGVLLVGTRDDPRLEARAPAGVDDQRRGGADDPALVAQFVQMQTLARRQRVGRGQRGLETIAEERQQAQARRVAGRGAEGQRHVGLARAHDLERLVGLSVDEADLDVRVLAVQGAQRAGDEGRGGRREARDPQRPRLPPRSASRLRSAAVSAAITVSACSTSVRPASVRRRRPGSRSTSRIPVSRSSLATWRETAGWVRCSASAAAENDPCRATSRSTRMRSVRSMLERYRTQAQSSLRA